MNKQDYDKQFQGWTGDEKSIEDEIKRVKGEENKNGRRNR